MWQVKTGFRSHLPWHKISKLNSIDWEAKIVINAADDVNVGSINSYCYQYYIIKVL